ncbi:hypothetical protein PPERSA_06714 [Pseudocohnilembus persalinus]|uniref:Uncharacterized protein n=1 Tax=Pseudocohnilembus persalinus TaxID=266149 RepID=A0A0V0QT50_PSEPJ|nr:hypothetical protein PPERSA_06714 [Pseudocohnilembus persalinus]|eukprot:KRX05080.1 hypothetical protein PPERSA_06714 [Pseudocohnilembus persalinus]
MIQLKDIINYDLLKIGCHLENICVYSVSPTKQIQQELDRQTKARVDANTEIIYAMSRKEVTDIEQEVTNLVSEQKATTNQKVEQIRAESAAYSETTRANGDAESIRVIAQARKEEAKELQSVQIAQELASIRVLGEAGEKIFKGEKNSFVYGKNPGDVLFSMFGKQIKN